MAELLEIDGKVYEPSTALAGAFDYTADYVSKLAREGKVLAQQVGRQWYVDRDSLRDFSHHASKQKLVRKESLRKERKFERAALSGAATVAQPALPHPTRAFAKAVMVFATVAVGASVSLVALDEGVGLEEMKQGSHIVATDVLELGGAVSVSGETQVGLLGWLKQYWSREQAVPAEQVGEEPESVLPVSKVAAGLILLDSASDEEVVNTVRAMFSDPVDVEFKGDDTGYITPVFDEVTDESYRFLLVPVRQANE